MNCSAEILTAPGRLRVLLISLMTLAALLALGLSGLPVLIKAVAAAAVIGFSYRSLRRRSSYRIWLHETEPDRLDGVSGELTLEAASAWYVVLMFRTPDRFQRILLFADEFRGDGFRRICSQLRNR